jgi:hypothetical protein
MLEEQGHASLVRDLLQLHRTFTFRRYRIDLTGFLVAWLVVAIMVLFYVWMATWGS